MKQFKHNGRKGCRGWCLCFWVLLLVVRGFGLDPHVAPGKYLHRSWTISDGLPHNTVTCISHDRQGFLLVGTENGLARFDGDRFKVFDKRNTPALENDYITGLHVSARGILRVSTHGGGMVAFNNGRFRKMSGPGKAAPGQKNPIASISRELYDRRIHTLLEDSRGVTWAGTDNGLYRRARQVWMRVRALQGGMPVLCLLEDKDGRLWIGTSGNGLHCLGNPRFPFYTVDDGLSHNYITTIYQDDRDIVWIGTHHGLNRFENGKFRVFTRAHGLCSNRITSLCRDKDGHLWIATPMGLNRVANGRFDGNTDNNIKIYTTRHGLPDNDVRVLFRDRLDNLWIGAAHGGLVRFSKGGFIKAGDGAANVKSKIRSPDTPVLSLADGNAGTLWIGTRKGLFKLNTRKNIFRGFIGQRTLSKYVIRDVYKGNEGSLWLGTANRGPVCYFKGKVIPYPMDSPLANTGIYNILEDNDGHLWLTTGRGVFVFRVHSLDYFRYDYHSEFRRPKLKYVLLSAGAGLKSSVFTGHGQPAGCKTPDGRFWLPTVQGAVVIRPAEKLLEKPLFKVIIEKAEASGHTFKPGDSPTLAGEDTDMTFYFTALNFDGVEDLQFRCTLIHLPSERTARETIVGHAERRVRFDKLPPARYRFRVTAGNRYSGWNKEGADFFFRVSYRMPAHEVLLLILTGLLAVMLVAVMRLIDRRAKEREMLRIFKDDERYKTSGMKPKAVRKHMLELLTLMDEEKPYLDPDMSVAKLAQRLELPKEHISQIINQRFYMNFNQFLNKYRIEEAKKLLRDPRQKDFVVLKIAYDVGFNSKSTFNTAFKKFTGISPSQYRDEFLEKTGTKS
jgi:ligand-binding sensor domain-containing protein/AraC-like DNA-binding protein